MEKQPKTASKSTGPSSCSLTVAELTRIAEMKPDWVVAYLKEWSHFDADGIGQALRYASEKAKIDLAANAESEGLT